MKTPRFSPSSSVKVRSLVVGMFLATTPTMAMAEEPAQKVIAVVLGRDITANEQDQASGIILGALLERFSKENHVVVEKEDLDAFVKRSLEMERERQIQHRKDRNRLQAELKSDALSAKDRKAKEEHLKNLQIILRAQTKMDERRQQDEKAYRKGKRVVGQHFVRAWKINKALHDKYGGRIIFQQAGPEPLDAYRKFLKEQEKCGSFEIFSPDLKKSFWKYFVDESMHVFSPAEQGKEMMAKPWWLMKPPSPG